MGLHDFLAYLATTGSFLQNGGKGKKKRESSSVAADASSMVFFRGSMIDLDKLHQQLAESESSTRHIKDSIIETEAEIERVKSRKMQLEKNALKDGTEIETLQATLNQETGKLGRIFKWLAVSDGIYNSVR